MYDIAYNVYIYYQYVKYDDDGDDDGNVVSINFGIQIFITETNSIVFILNPVYQDIPGLQL